MRIYYSEYTTVQACRDVRKDFWPLMSYTIGLESWGGIIGRKQKQEDLIKVLSC